MAEQVKRVRRRRRVKRVRSGPLQFTPARLLLGADALQICFERTFIDEPQAPDELPRYFILPAELGYVVVGNIKALGQLGRRQKTLDI